MLTPEGAAFLWESAAGDGKDSLVGGTIVVSDGKITSSRPLDAVSVEGATVKLIATFGEEDANFEWTTAEVRSAAGVLVDRETRDNGRKTAGAVWTLETVLELGVPA